MQYFKIDLFIDVLLLVLHVNTTDVIELVNTLLTTYESEKKNAISSDNEPIDLYVNLIREVMSTGTISDNRAGLEAYLLKIKNTSTISKDPELYSTLRSMFLGESELSQSRIAYIKDSINNCLVWCSNTAYMKKIYSKIMSGSATTDRAKQNKILEEMNALCTEITNMNTNHLAPMNVEEDSPTISRFVDFTDAATLKKTLTVFKNTSVKNIFKTGWQGLNRALGPVGGTKLGESMVYNALSGHGKTFMLLKMARWTVTLNKLTSEFPRPTCIIYSLENETPQNLILLFEEMYINKYKKRPPEDITEDDIVAFCQVEFNNHGWTLIIDRRVGTDFGYEEFVADFNKYKNAGYNVLLVIIDYINMMKKKADKRDGNHLAVRELYNSNINFCKINNCSMITAHQLNRDAANVVKFHPTRSVERLGIEHLADATDPQREIDCAIYMCKEKNQHNEWWLTFKMDKHRYDNGKTPDRDKLFAYKFEDELGIPDDVFTNDKSVRDIYAIVKKGNNNSANMDLF